MSQALMIAVGVLVAYSFLKIVKSIPRLLKAQEKSFVIGLIVYMVLVPVGLYGVSALPDTNLKAWLAVPIIMLGFMWLLMGFFVDAKLKKMQMPNQNYTKPESKKIKLAIVACVLAVAAWIVGAMGIYPNTTVSNIVMCIILFLCAFAFSTLNQYRKALQHEKMIQAKKDARKQKKQKNKSEKEINKEIK